MDVLLIVLILGLNVLISIWNCYAVGTSWKDVMAMGSGFEKLVLWSGVIQSGVGFSMPILLVLTFGSVAYLTTNGAMVDGQWQTSTLTTADGETLLSGVFSPWYVAIILPILGSGFAITAHSLRAAYRRRDFASIASAGWNSFAQIHNTVGAVRNLGGAFGDIGKLFDVGSKGGDSKNKVVILAIVLVVLSIVGGFMIAFGLVKFFAARAESRLEEYARTELRSARRHYA
jgi:hypothetical protein